VKVIALIILLLVLESVKCSEILIAPGARFVSGTGPNLFNISNFFPAYFSDSNSVFLILAGSPIHIIPDYSLAELHTGCVRKRHFIGATIRKLGIPEYHYLELGASYGKSVSPKLKLGMGLYLTQTQISKYRNQSSASATLSGNIRVVKRSQLGLRIQLPVHSQLKENRFSSLELTMAYKQILESNNYLVIEYRQRLSQSTLNIGISQRLKENVKCNFSLSILDGKPGISFEIQHRSMQICMGLSLFRTSTLQQINQIAYASKSFDHSDSFF